MKKQLILASKSPRRSELLKKAGLDFTIIESGYEEKSSAKRPKKVVKDFAFNKAKTVFDGLKNKQDFMVLGADTIVVLGKKILGKPKDEVEAKNMLKSLSNRTHTVITGYAVLTENKAVCKSVKTKVIFNDLSDSDIEEYIRSGSPFDKAGGYGIQDDFPLVKGYKGSIDNVIGLPVKQVVKSIEKLNNK